MNEHSEEVMERRRQAFEQHYKSRYGMSVSAQYQHDVGYSSYTVDERWITWNAALDSVVIDLPGFRELRMGRPQEVTQYDSGVNHGICLCTDAIESTGLGLRVTS